MHYPINKNIRPGPTRRTSFNDVCISSGLSIPIVIQARYSSQLRVPCVCIDETNMPTESASSHHGHPSTRSTATIQPGDPPFSISILYILRFPGSLTRTAPSSGSNSVGALIDVALRVPIVRRPRIYYLPQRHKLPHHPVTLTHSSPCLVTPPQPSTAPPSLLYSTVCK